MKTNSITLSFIFFLLAFFLASCEDKLDNPNLTVSPDELIQMENDGGTATVTVEANVDDWTWQLDNGEWISVEKNSSGLVLEVEANQGNERRAILHIASSKFPLVNKMLSIKQEATFLRVSSDTIDISGEGAVVDVTVATSVDDWTFSIENGEWINVEKTETGLRLTAPVNSTPTTRIAILSITSVKFPIVDKIIPVNQVTGVVLNVDPLTVVLPSGGCDTIITVNTNVDSWGYSFTENWLTAEKTENGLKLKATSNPGLVNLSTVLTIYSIAYPNEIWKQIEISQYSSLIFEDAFDWLGAGANATIFYGTGEKRFEYWESTYGTVNGWSSTISDLGHPYVYSRLGFLKTGKTRVGGDMITPKLVAIDGTKDIVVSFKATAYLSSHGTGIDNNEFNIKVIGPGTVTQILSIGSQLETPEGKQPSSGQLTDGGAKFMIGNYPNPEASTYSHWQGADYDSWASEYAERSFVVSGATCETQIQFIGGPNVGVLVESNRIGFDDVRIVLQ